MKDDAQRITTPVHVSGPDGPWEGVGQGMALRGNATVFTTWGEWLTAALAEPALRPLLGRDWLRYRQTTDPTIRYRFVASRLAVKYTAAAALGADPADLDLAYKIGGRPYLRGFDQIDVSLTHTDDLIAVGISRTGRIGVDTEPADRKLSFDLLQDQVCTAAEKAELAAVPEAEPWWSSRCDSRGHGGRDGWRRSPAAGRRWPSRRSGPRCRAAPGRGSRRSAAGRCGGRGRPPRPAGGRGRG
ncbi:4'-phosphopantetheinyl transferase family protein [Streptomyces sp. NPDC001193]